MGCCISTCSEPKSPNKLRQSPPASGKIAAAGDRDPPQPEEETVKEVLSAETPFIPRPQSPPPPPTLPVAVAVEDRKPEAAPPRDEQRVEAKTEEVRIEATGARSAAVIARSDEVSEISQVSDLNSVSESVETASAVARDEEVASSNSRDYSTAVEVRRRPAAGTVPKLVGRERRLRSPDAAKNAAPSPEKRNRGAAAQPGAAATATSRRRSPSPGGYRRDSGGASGAARRSRSPATRTDGGAAHVVKNMSPKAKIAGKSAVAAPTAAAEEKSEAGDDKLEGPEQQLGELSVTNETLEDPSVSLECFIFL